MALFHAGPSRCALAYSVKRSLEVRWVDEFHEVPVDRRKLTKDASFLPFALPMSARQADRSYLPDIGLFRYFIFPYPERARHNRAFAFIAGVGQKMEKLFFHTALKGEHAIFDASLLAQHRLVNSDHETDQRLAHRHSKGAHPLPRVFG